jgi:hypothetical protein
MTEPFVPWSPKAIKELCAMVSAADGEPRADADFAMWMGVATTNRWRHAEAVQAVVQLAGRWGRSDTRRIQILPGSVDEVIRANRQQPRAWAELEAERPVVDEATVEQRRTAMAAFVQGQVARMSIDAAVFEPGETLETVLSKQARGDYRGIDWSAVDACSECDEGGMRRDAPDLVCTHPPQERRGAVVQSGAHTHHEGTTEGADDHGEHGVGAEAPAAAGDGERGAAAHGGGAGPDPGVGGVG